MRKPEYKYSVKRLMGPPGFEPGFRTPVKPLCKLGS